MLRFAALFSLAAVALPLRPPPRGGVPRGGVSGSPASSYTSTKALYAQIDGILRRAQKQSEGMAARTARALGNRWTEMEPAALVEVCSSHY